MKFIKKAVFYGALMFVIFSCKQSKTLEKPNVVYILTDQWRASATGYAGDPNVKTPNLDRFAAEAVNFRNAVSVCPVCTPHRASLLTGRYPTSTGMFLNDIHLPDKELCMAEIFKAEGYNTAYIGKWHLDGYGRMNNVEPERRQGFDYWKALECSHNYMHMAYYENDDPELKYWPGYSPFALADDASTYLKEHANGEQPFLLFVSFGTPHYPHNNAPKEFYDLYLPDSLKLNPNIPTELEEKTRQELQGYYAHCTATDQAIGRILGQVKKLGLDKNTIVVFTSDHGEMMGAHGVKPFVKQLPWEESLRVPFLIRYPSIGSNEGTVVDAPINTPDILPSLLTLAGLPIPETVEGEDLSALIKKTNLDADRAALVMDVCPFGGTNYRDPEYRAIRTKRYTYVRTLAGPAQLFDNWNDPYQLRNLVNIPEYSSLQAELDGRLDSALQAIGDDFQPREYYLKKWNLSLDEKRHAVDFWSFSQGKGNVQTPHLTE